MNDGVRQCVCKEGYSGDGVNECKSMICIHIEYLVCWFAFRKNMKFWFSAFLWFTELCGGKYLCHKNARCDNEMCQCNNGLFGDGILSCQGRYVYVTIMFDAKLVSVHHQKTKYFNLSTSISILESCTCMATGDPHYRTFDGQMIHFMGECKYTLSQFKSTDKCSFNVEVKNVKRHQNAKVSFTRLVDVKVPGYNIRLLQEKRLIVRNSRS